MKLLKAIIILVVFVVVLVAAGYWSVRGPAVVAPNGVATSTGSTSSSTTSNVIVFDKTLSDGTVTITYPSKDFGLATNQSQVLATSYIPPCDENYDYCFYYTGDAYKGTNFESAGLRVQQRTDLKTEDACVATPPDGFATTTLPSGRSASPEHSSAVFDNVGDAAAGHTASGSLYRLYVKAKSSCYEFQTRIGQTQFDNYPPGTIQEFTTADSQKIQAELDQMINQIHLPSGKKELFS